MSKDASLHTSATDLRIGFVELLDAAPLVAAFEMGHFADEGLRIVLERQVGWGNVRDKLVFGQLQASHALVGMPPLSVMGSRKFSRTAHGNHGRWGLAAMRSLLAAG